MFDARRFLKIRACGAPIKQSWLRVARRGHAMAVSTADAGTELAAKVTVVVLTHNRRDELACALSHLARSPCRIIVVDNAGTDATSSMLCGAAGVDVVTLPRNIGGAGRNAGLETATTPYVALCDDDTWWPPGSMEGAARLLDERPDLALVTGRVLVGAGQTLDSMCEEMSRSPLGYGDDKVGYPVLGFLAGATMARREALLSVGGFDERFFIGGEEEIVALDLASKGWDLRYAPGVVVHHHPSSVRDPLARARFLVRNKLWTAILRYPMPLLRSQARDCRARASADGSEKWLVTQTVRALPWLLRGRRPLPPDVVRRVELLRDTARSAA